MVHFQNIRNEPGFVDGQKLAEFLNSHVYDKDNILPLHIAAQNAGIIITQNQDAVVMEAFELSPTNEAVMDTAGRLQRHFPASAISIPAKKFLENGFIRALTDTTETMSHQEVNEAKPKFLKKGENHIEERDTTDPFLVTDFLRTVLLAYTGEAKPASSISKNTREEVIWKDALMPWWRSPVWLLIRVTLQLRFERLHSDRPLYKEFMISLMAYTLDIAQKRGFSSDVLYCMMAKIARRLTKLGGDVEVSWMKNIHDTLDQTRACLQRRWVLISQESDADVDLKILSKQILPTEGLEPYPGLDDFIRSIASRQNEECISTFKAPWILRRYDQSSLQDLNNLSDKSISFHLSAFEKWVESSLLLWMHEANESTCSHLYDLTKTYYNLSQKCYSGCPESLSITSLTILELWMAYDKFVCDKIPLVEEYSTQIPAELLQSLLLHSKNHLERLILVEKYIKQRCGGTLSGICSSFGHENSFSVRYYATSTIHRTLRENIEQLATEERERKRKEFRDKRREYENLLSRSARLACDYITRVDRRTGRRYQEHSGSCKKHDLLDQAEGLVINVHEWPLPDAELRARSTVSVPGEI